MKTSMRELQLPFVLGMCQLNSILASASASAFDREPGSSVAVAAAAEDKNGGNGNPLAAADLYGAGIRIGIYMQTIGMLMSLVSVEQPKFKFAAATTSIAVLLSWTILAQRKSFSACEAWLILSIIGTFVFPGGAALCTIRDVADEGIGIVAIWISILWLFSSIIWLFASLVYQLPSLGTSNIVWIFKQEPITGWFRTLTLAIGCVLLVTSFLTALTSAILVRAATHAWYAGKERAKIPWKQVEEEALRSFKYSQCMAGLLMWVLAIISCEKIIQWNGLSPENDLSRPGQAIPLVVGILILMDGIGDLFKEPARFFHIDTWKALLKQVTLGSFKNAARTLTILSSVWKEWRATGSLRASGIDER